MQKAKPKSVSFRKLNFVPRFEHRNQAEIAEVTGTGEGTNLGTGFARFRAADFHWQVRYDEVLVVLEGKVTIETGTGSLVAGPRDCVWLPKDTELRYRSDDALVFYAIYPADWAERET